MTKRLSADQRGRIAEKIMEWGNLVFIGMVIVQVIPGPFNPVVAITGIALIATAYGLAVKLMKGGDK